MSAQGTGGAEAAAGSGAGAGKTSAGQSAAGSGFAAGAQTEGNAPLTQGLGPADMQALQSHGVSVVGPQHSLSGAEQQLMQPQSSTLAAQAKEVEGQQAASREARRERVNASIRQGGGKGQQPFEAIPDIGSLEGIMSTLGGSGGAMSDLERMAAQAQQQGAPPIIQMRAEGGPVEGGDVALVGEEGDAPELVTNPAGNDPIQVTPLTESDRYKAAAAPEKPGLGMQILRKVGDIALGAAGPGGVAAVQGRKQAQAAHADAIAKLAYKNPQLLHSSPEAVQAFEGVYGAGSAQKHLDSTNPDLANQRLAEQMNIPIAPPGALLPGGQVAGSATSQVWRQLIQHGYGATIDTQGRIKATQSPMSATERGMIVGYNKYNDEREALVAAGINPSRADQIAARRAAAWTAANGLRPSDDLVKLGQAGTDAEIAAHKASLTEQAKQQVQLQYAATIASERRRGGVLGTAAGEAEVPFQTIEVPIGVDKNTGVPQTVTMTYNEAKGYAATGSRNAVPLGKNPTKPQLTQAINRDMDIVFGENGELYGLPVGEQPDAVPATLVAQGPEAAPAIRDVMSVLDRITKDPKFLDASFDESVLGKAPARSLQWWRSWIAPYIDDAEVLTTRGRVRQLGFRMARLLGSNSQLSDAERDNASAVWGKVAAGTASRQEILSAVKSTKGWMNTITRGRAAPEKTKKKVVSAEVVP